MLQMHCEPKPDMMAVELFHTIVEKVPVVLAQMLLDELGRDPHYRFNRSSHWNAEFIVVDADVGMADRMPFQLVLLNDGTAELVIRWCDRTNLAHVLTYYGMSIVTCTVQ